MESPRFTLIRQYLDLISRKKWLILTCILLGASFGLFHYLKQNKVYKAEALLSYQQQKVNPSQMSPDEETGIRDIVSTLTQLVTSRSSLEKIILDENLYEEIRGDVPIDGLIGIMRDNINIVQSMFVQSDTRDRGDTFVIEYYGSDPEVIVRVTNKLASRFIEENLRYRQERATETSAYTEKELEMAKEILDRKEAVMRDYKLQYYNEMPDQRELNMSRLIALQEQYQGTQESIQDLERTRVLIQDQINVRKQIIEEMKKETAMQEALSDDGSTSININKEAKLEMLENGLEDLQQRYTDQHPQVKRLKRQIQSLKILIASEKLDEEGDSPKFDDELFDLQIQIKDINLSIEKLEKEKEDIRVLINKYDQWVESAPVREAEWSSLTREYAELKRHYDFLVSQNLQALSALNLERNQKGSQFKIEDYARVPETPVSPNFNKIMILSIFAGVMAGAVLALGLEIADTSFKSQFELEQAIELPVICSVPRLSLAREVAQKRAGSFGKAIFFLIWLFAIGLVLVDQRNESSIIAAFMQNIK